MNGFLVMCLVIISLSINLRYALLASSHLKLKCGKAAGSDDLCAEYFKFAHNKLHVLLSMCFTLFCTHSYLPAPMIETIIVPIVKNKCGNLCDSNNYRPIARATLMSKLFESVILLKCETFWKRALINLVLRKATAQKCASMF